MASDEQASELRPRRSLPGTAVALKAAVVAKAWQKFARKYVDAKKFGDTTDAKIYEAGTTSATEPALRPLRLAAHALLLAPTPEALRAASIDTLAAARVMASRVDRISLFDAIATVRSVSDLVRVALRACDFTIASDGNYTVSAFIASHTRAASLGGEEQWLPVRHAICSASDEAYAAAVADATELWPSLGELKQILLGYLFPDETWANQLALAPFAADPNRKPWQSSEHTLLLGAVTQAAAVHALLDRGAKPYQVATYALDLAHVIPEAELLPLLAGQLTALLVKPKHGPLLKTPPRLIAEAIAFWRTPTAAAVLAPYATNAVLAPVVLAYFREAPELSAALEGKSGKRSASIERVLTGGNRASRAPDAKLATDAEVPGLLRERTWRQAPARLGSPLTLELQLDDERVALPHGLAPFDRTRQGYQVRDQTEAELAAWRQAAAADKLSYVDYVWDYQKRELVRVPAADGIAHWNQGHGYLSQSPLQWVALHGIDVLPGFTKRDWLRWDDASGYREAVMSFISPRIAVDIAKAAARKRTRQAAQRWLTENPEVAALGLIPAALGAIATSRDAQAALRYVAIAGHGATIAAMAQRYGAAAATQIQALLDDDPLRLGAKAPKLPDFLRLAELADVQLNNGALLDDTARAALVEMLQAMPVDGTYPGITIVRSACSADSLGAFALDLVEQWVLGDMPGRHEWMVYAAAHLPSVASTRRVIELARQWARKNGAKAERFAQVLVAIGDDAALQALAHIADTTRYDALRTTVSAMVQEVAAARGLSSDELADRVVPDAGLDSRGRLTLTLGARTVVVELDETLTPVVREQTADGLGPRTTALPRPNRTDDPVLAKTARATFAAFKGDVAAIAQRTMRRFERAMVDGRCWPVADFTQYIAHHPLLTHVARRLLWDALDADGTLRSFRVAEDGTFADASDATIKLAADAQIRIAHPARGIAPQWNTIFADYELIQPFAQLGRQVCRLDADELAQASCKRWAGITIAPAKLLGMFEARGWQRNDAGYVASYRRVVRMRTGSTTGNTTGNTTGVTLMLSQGFEINGLATAPPAVTGELQVAAQNWAELDEVALSEVLLDCSQLAGLS